MAFAGDSREPCSGFQLIVHVSRAPLSAQQQAERRAACPAAGARGRLTTSPGYPAADGSLQGIDNDSSVSFLWGVWLKTRPPFPTPTERISNKYTLKCSFRCSCIFYANATLQWPDWDSGARLIPLPNIQLQQPAQGPDKGI